MDARWVALGVALIFGVLALLFASDGNTVQAVVSGVASVVALGVFAWYWRYDGADS